VPYQWLPFSLLRRAEEQQDQVLASLHGMRTIVKLPLTNPSVAAEVIKSLWTLPAYVLLTFRHLRQLDIKANDKNKSFSVQMPTNTDTELSITDTREEQTQHWRRAMHRLKPPLEALVEFEDEDDRRRAADISVAVATLLDSEAQVTPLAESMMLHVYYPTEDPAPIRVLLHADFVVKSDRTKIVPDFRFNRWVLERLGNYVVDCVERWYSESSPAANLRLLLPTDDFRNGGVSANLWGCIEARAKATLKLPDASGNRVLTFDVACRIATSVASGLARKIFEKSGYAPRLVHPSLENDEQARRVLDKLGCTRLRDGALFAAIGNAVPALARDVEWLWMCWLWVGEWAVAERKQDWKPEMREERLSRLRKTPILSIEGQSVSVESIGKRVVTWRDATVQFAVPAWLPASFIDDWLRDKLLVAPNESPVRLLLSDFCIKDPNQNLIPEALAYAIADFWKTRQGDARRFFNYLATLRLHEQLDASENLQRCPIRATIEGKTDNYYVEARHAYFGREWGENLLAELYDGVKGTAWAKRPNENVDANREILTWLGVVAYPRLVARSGEGAQEEELRRVSRQLPTHTGMGNVAPPLVMDKFEFSSLNRDKARALLHLLVRHWHYYSTHTSLSIRYKYYNWYFHSVPAHWWERLKAQLGPPLLENDALPVPLERCWLPDRATRRAVGLLLPTIDLDSFGSDRSEVEKWLAEHARLRTQLAQLSITEWRDLLQNRVPTLIPPDVAGRDSDHQKVFGWYEACLESLSTQEAELPLANVPLLCRRGEAWAYIDQEPRWLSDDSELAEAFRQDIWQIAFPERLHAAARKYFGLKPLSDAKCQPRWDTTTGQANSKLQVQLDSIKQFVFVWRCYKTKQDSEQLRAHLQRLEVRVAEKLEAEVMLSELLPPKLVSKSVAIEGDILFLCEGKADLPRLAEAVAQSVRTPSDADFLENLLRCETDASRIQKLEARNCPSDQIQRLLHEFRSLTACDPVETRASSGANVEERAITSGDPTPLTPLPDTGSTLASAPPINEANGVTGAKSTVESSPTAVITSNVLEHGPSRALQSKSIGLHQLERGAQEKAPIALNHPDLVPADIIDVGVHTGSLPQRTRSQQEQSTKHESVGGFASTTVSDKGALEQCGREYATHELQLKGYEVTPMPQQNPGYDLLARKAGETLKVEVKAHSGEATNVFITQREWEEYLRMLPSRDERWELWNVENLVAGSKPKITIVRYIPDSVPRESGYWIDINQCFSERPT